MSLISSKSSSSISNICLLWLYFCACSIIIGFNWIFILLAFFCSIVSISSLISSSFELELPDLDFALLLLDLKNFVTLVFVYDLTKNFFFTMLLYVDNRWSESRTFFSSSDKFSIDSYENDLFSMVSGSGSDELSSNIESIYVTDHFWFGVKYLWSSDDRVWNSLIELFGWDGGTGVNSLAPLLLLERETGESINANNSLLFTDSLP